jgi:hypothetical protein
MEVSGQLHALAALPPGKEPPVAINRRLGVRCGEEKNLALPGIEPGPSSPSLYRLTYFELQVRNHKTIIQKKRKGLHSFQYKIGGGGGIRGAGEKRKKASCQKVWESLTWTI